MRPSLNARVALLVLLSLYSLASYGHHWRVIVPVLWCSHPLGTVLVDTPNECVVVEGSGLGVESENLAKLFIKITIVPNANILCLLSLLRYVSNLYLS